MVITRVRVVVDYEGENGEKRTTAVELKNVEMKVETKKSLRFDEQLQKSSLKNITFMSIEGQKTKTLQTI